MDTYFPALFLALICAAIGFTAGAFVSSLRSSKASTTTPPPNCQEVARFWRDRRSGKPILEVKGKRFRTASELSPEQKQYISRLLIHFQAWLGPVQTSEAAAEDPRLAPKERSTIPEPIGVEKAPGGDGTLFSKPSAANTQDAFSERPSMSPVDLFARALKSDSAPVTERRSIAAQVDEILQEMLDRPDLSGSPIRNQGIRLMEIPGKGMVVMVGLDRYDGVEAVPDPEVRNIIKAAVAEWESRVEVG